MFFWRWLVVPFERTFADGAPGTIPRDRLDAMLADPTELSGVLNKALEAIAAIRSRGLSESDSTRRAMDEFRQATDPLAVWLDRHTVLRADAVISQDRLYREYCRNCSDAGRPTISKTAFGRAMKKLRPTVADYQRTVNGVLAWCYVGIGLVAKEESVSHVVHTVHAVCPILFSATNRTAGTVCRGVVKGPESAEQDKRNRVNSVNRVTGTGGVGTLFAIRAAGETMARCGQRQARKRVDWLITGR